MCIKIIEDSKDLLFIWVLSLSVWAATELSPGSCRLYTIWGAYPLKLIWEISSSQGPTDSRLGHLGGGLISTLLRDGE